MLKHKPKVEKRSIIRADIPLDFQLLSSRETATILRIGMEALATLRDSGQLPCVPMEDKEKNGKEEMIKQLSRKKTPQNKTATHCRYRYRAVTVKAFMEEREVTLKDPVE